MLAVGVCACRTSYKRTSYVRSYKNIDIANIDQNKSIFWKDFATKSGQ